MAKNLDLALVVDVESTCWEGDPPPGQASEIIEVGLCPVDLRSLERLERRSLLVKPVNSEISAFCTSLTTLEPSMFRDALNLQDAAKILKTEYVSKSRLWVSWGDYDRRQFERVCHAQGVAYPFGTSHLNLKSLFATARGLSQEVGLQTAYELLGRTMDGTHHRGHDDAWNIAGIYCDLLKKIRESC